MIPRGMEPVADSLLGLADVLSVVDAPTLRLYAQENRELATLSLVGARPMPDGSISRQAWAAVVAQRIADVCDRVADAKPKQRNA